MAQQSTIKDNETLNPDNPEDREKLSEIFVLQNDALFKLLSARLAEYSSTCNSLYLNWLAQAVLELIRDVNKTCLRNLKEMERQSIVQ